MNKYINSTFFKNTRVFKKGDKVTLIPDKNQPKHYHNNRYSGENFYVTKDTYGSYVNVLPVGKTMYDVEKELFAKVENTILDTFLLRCLYGVAI